MCMAIIQEQSNNLWIERYSPLDLCLLLGAAWLAIWSFNGSFECFVVWRRAPPL